VSANAERGTLLVDHDEIPGFMAAMTMEFKAAPGDVANAKPGRRIRAVLYRADDGFHLEQVWPVDAANERIVDEAARTLRQDTVTRGKNVYREIGERLPDFALYDQSGAVVQAARFRGKQIVLNFIFTRCPDPHMCPAATARMIGLQAQARDAGVTNLELVSISLDPEYDTPGVLREYAEMRGIDTSNFSLLTGPERAIKDLLKQLGIETLNNGPLVQHTIATILISEEGKIAHRVDGSTWDPGDFLARLRKPGVNP
jgi:protein SCO1/2